jgi:hypothetical protein
MKRFIALAAVAALAAGVTDTAWSQGGQGGGPAGGATSRSTGAAAAPNRAAGAPAAAQAPGNAAANAQLGAGQNQIGGGFQARTIPGAGVNTSAPWFNNPMIRQQLNLTDAQLNQLTRTYQDPFINRNAAITGQGTATAAAQRQRALQEFQARQNANGTPGTANAAAQRQQQLDAFQNRAVNDNFNTTLDQVLTDPQTRQRFDQLNRQYMGPFAFNDPLVQRQLNLTPDQQLALRKLAAGWQRSLSEMRQSNQEDPSLSQQQWNNFLTQYQDQLSTILTPAQQQQWNQLVGDRFDFPMATYLRAGADPQSAADVNPIIQSEAVERAQRNNRAGQAPGIVR